MNVHQLIELLRKAPSEAEVYFHDIDGAYASYGSECELIEKSAILLEEGPEPRVLFDGMGSLAFRDLHDGVPVKIVGECEAVRISKRKKQVGS